MKLMYLGLAGLAAAAALEAGPALAARQAYEDAFFVRPHATAQAMLQDRSDCRNQADHMSDTAASYSNPQYGALSAMGSALDEDALHDGGLHKRLQQAVFNDCMKQKGWTAADPTSAEARELKASQHHPELLDAWLKAHEPAEPPPAPPAAPAPTAQTVKAAAPAAAAATTPATKTAN
jgi:hypothetical protein